MQNINTIIALLIIIFSFFFDFAGFYIINGLQSSFFEKVFIVLFLIISFTVTIIFRTTGILINNILFLLFIYVLYHKKMSGIILIGSSLVPLTIDLIIDMMNDIFYLLLPHRSIFIAFENDIIVLLYLLALYLIFKLKNSIKQQLTDKNKKIFLALLFYFYLSVVSVFLINIFFKEKDTVVIIFSVLLILQIIFMISVYYLIINLQSKLFNRREQETIEEKQKQLEEYATYLEKSEDDLRAFRHDYRNILNSLKISAKEGKTQEVVALLDKYTKTNLNSQALLKYKDVNHVQVKPIKSIIIAKLTEIYNLGYSYNFECRKNITKIPNNIDNLDLVRIIGITFDNAIEESKALVAKTHNIRDANIQAMVYSDGPNEFEFEIKNKMRKKKISTSKIQEKGFTTKKDHKGLGLANIREFEKKYPEISISYTIEDGWFDFYMVIDEEDDD